MRFPDFQTRLIPAIAEVLAGFVCFLPAAALAFDPKAPDEQQWVIYTTLILYTVFSGPIWSVCLTYFVAGRDPKDITPIYALGWSTTNAVTTMAISSMIYRWPIAIIFASGLLHITSSIWLLWFPKHPLPPPQTEAEIQKEQPTEVVSERDRVAVEIALLDKQQREKSLRIQNLYIFHSWTLPAQHLLFTSLAPILPDIASDTNVDPAYQVAVASLWQPAMILGFVSLLVTKRWNGSYGTTIVATISVFSGFIVRRRQTKKNPSSPPLLFFVVSTTIKYPSTNFFSITTKHLMIFLLFLSYIYTYIPLPS
jgi:hypothetical protein